VTRQQLVEVSTRQRAALVATAEPLVRKAAALDRVVSYVSRNPALPALALGAFALVGPRKIFELATRAVTLYALFRR
jgi:hypothetical protein